jgi:hypothetical protein
MNRDVKWNALRRGHPPYGRKLLLLLDCGAAISGYRRAGWGGGFCTQRTGGGRCVTGVTHWLPFPRK